MNQQPLPTHRRPYSRRGIELLLEGARLDELLRFQRVVEKEIRRAEAIALQRQWRQQAL